MNSSRRRGALCLGLLERCLLAALALATPGATAVGDDDNGAVANDAADLSETDRSDGDLHETQGDAASLEDRRQEEESAAGDHRHRAYGPTVFDEAADKEFPSDRVFAPWKDPPIVESGASPGPANRSARSQFEPPLREQRPISGQGTATSIEPPSPEGDESESWLGGWDPRRSELFRVGGSLAIVIGLILLLRIAIRRVGSPLLGGRRPSGVIEILARYPVGRGQQIILLKLVRRIVLLHHAGTTMTALSEVSDPEEAAMLLARIEAGLRSGSDDEFRSVMERLTAEPERAMQKGPRSPAALASFTGTETIDLTQRDGTVFTRLLRRMRGGT